VRQGRFVTAADHGPVDPARIDAAVVAALYEQYAGELSLFLRGVLRNADLAAEALQNTFTKAVESGHTARAESLKGWLFQVAFREALLIRRRSRVHERSLRQIVRDIQVSPKSSELPEERAFRSETLDEVRRALRELPPDQRQVIQMRIYEEKTFAVIAEELSLPLGTVLTRMRLALKRLSRQIRGTGNGKP
jgi:RNA polymerase sigma-70 factor, ECF subfamily